MNARIQRQQELVIQLVALIKDVYLEFPDEGTAMVESAWSGVKPTNAGANQVDSEGSYWLD
jgi:hypothetical protein